MDKSWIGMPRNTSEYLLGLNQFLDFEFNNGSIGDKYECPCPKCGFGKWQTRNIVFDHLINKPFPKNYVTWVMHGEMNVLPNSRNTETTQATPPTENPIELLVNEAFGGLRHEGVDVGPSPVVEEEETLHDTPAINKKNLFELLKDGSQELYEGSKYSKLEFLLKLYHIKCLSGLSDKRMTMILDLLRDAFKFAKIPDSFYEAKKTINKLSLDCIKIDACPNDCMLYWEDDVNVETCKYCHTSRWKPKKKSNTDHTPTTRKKKKKKQKKNPAKILRYFPLKPRLQRLFMCSKIAKHMKWHAEDDNKDGTLRHPRDSEAWKKFGLASDGFNPFGTMSTSHSIWPVILVPYNLPPWLCMKQPNFILSMIIPGPRAPRNNIDVYLQPFIKELKELWSDGVDTFDSSKNEMFRMRAALMWTVSDFPGLDSLSGWNTHTGLACPSCNFDAEPCRLPYSRKWCFIGHRQFLSRNHKFRMMRHHFDGTVEERTPPKKLSGSDIFQQVKDINVTFGRPTELNRKRKRNKQTNDDEGGTQQWRKKSIFFDLPYWESNLLRHNLDVMHIEKNVFDNIIYTLLNDKEKSKDHIKARKDLQDMGIWHDLWPDENGECRLGAFTIPKKKKLTFLKTLKNIVVPDGYATNISCCIDLDKKKIFGLKSHDCHILMQQLLPIAIRNVLPNQVVATLVEFSSSFRQLCMKSLTISNLEKLQNQIVETLSHLEILFPPSFFTVMIHLTVYLVDEVKQGGPVHYRWMYFVERLLGHFKSLVRNKSQSEGSIAEGHKVEEVLTLYSRYFDEIESRLNRPKRVNDEPNHNEASGKSSIFPQQDRCARQEDLPYYGKLEEIIELNYYGRFRVILFKCLWADTTRNRGYKPDAWKFNCVNFSKLIHTGDREDHDPYIEASQANMVYYVDDETDKEWSIVVHLKPRDLFEMGEVDEEDLYKNEPYQQQEFGQFFDDDYENIQIAIDENMNE
ncbi:uncharacterized protein LOC125853389 [Solanum stenotomum]|uniref:uncharacterized protein LOC125853389 n=1 Tax=Solanum stenotomum TaxID=172797 RepID=UPI0020D01F6F|nr:uncharacterized protein LOC125853389 [Solanum stenotomum]